ncbi:MAG TPA: N-acetyltransferase [Pirellulales bacterium]|nr:N-acetyltransferase [Pirellulales bacterium]
MPPEVSVRDELPGDAAEIGEVVAAAFSSSPFGHHGEAQMVERLRRACPEALSLVANLADRLVGHVLFSPVVIHAAESLHGMGLAPMSVSPAFQRRGVGTLLIRRGIEILSERACSFVCVLGYPTYYGRFGFESAARFGLDSEFGGASDGTFQILWLRDDVTKEQAGGILRYRPEFSSLDHTFPLPPGALHNNP